MNIIRFAILFLSILVIYAVEPQPMPVYYPSAPHKDKPIVEYTTSDVLGCLGTIKLPDGHKFLEDKKFEAGLKINWPGAKNSASIDAMLQLVLDSPANTALGDLHGGLANVRIAVREIMDVNAEAKAEAVLRVVAAQTDPLKSARAKKFAADLFEDLLDPRLLTYHKERLDDITVVGDMTREAESGGNIHDIVTVRQVSLSTILLLIERTLGMPLDRQAFQTQDEAQNCAALKSWLTANWNQITAKCAEKAADANRKISILHPRQWDARQ